jgi:hypothetical protein
MDEVFVYLSKTEHDNNVLAINRIQYGAAEVIERCLAYSKV